MAGCWRKRKRRKWRDRDRQKPFTAAAVLVAGKLPASAQSQKPMNEAQARAYCAKAAEEKAAANRRQSWADACVKQVMARQKKS